MTGSARNSASWLSRCSAGLFRQRGGLGPGPGLRVGPASPLPSPGSPGSPQPGSPQVHSILSSRSSRKGLKSLQVSPHLLTSLLPWRPGQSCDLVQEGGEGHRDIALAHRTRGQPAPDSCQDSGQTRERVPAPTSPCRACAFPLTSAWSSPWPPWPLPWALLPGLWEPTPVLSCQRFCASHGGGWGEARVRPSPCSMVPPAQPPSLPQICLLPSPGAAPSPLPPRQACCP